MLKTQPGAKPGVARLENRRPMLAALRTQCVSIGPSRAPPNSSTATQKQCTDRDRARADPLFPPPDAAATRATPHNQV